MTAPKLIKTAAAASPPSKMLKTLRKMKTLYKQQIYRAEIICGAGVKSGFKVARIFQTS